VQGCEPGAIALFAGPFLVANERRVSDDGVKGGCGFDEEEVADCNFRLTARSGNDCTRGLRARTVDLNAMHDRGTVAKGVQAFYSCRQKRCLTRARLEHQVLGGADSPLGDVLGDPVWCEESSSCFSSRRRIRNGRQIRVKEHNITLCDEPPTPHPASGKKLTSSWPCSCSVRTVAAAVLLSH
jgi:hypothetical protein